MRAEESNSVSSSSTMRPRSGAINPAIMLMSVVLPAPEGPNRPATPLEILTRALIKKSPSRFSTSTASILFPMKPRAGAPRQPFRGNERRKRDEDRDQHKARRRGVSARRLGERVDRSRDGLRLSRDVRYERDRGAELAQRLGKAEHDAGNHAGQGQRQGDCEKNP